MSQTISARELQTTLGKIVNSVNQGEQFVVMYKSRPAFRIVPLEQEHSVKAPLADDPIYRSQAVGRSKDGLCAAEHDAVLYGGEK